MNVPEFKVNDLKGDYEVVVCYENTQKWQKDEGRSPLGKGTVEFSVANDRIPLGGFVIRKLHGPYRRPEKEEELKGMATLFEDEGVRLCALCGRPLMGMNLWCQCDVRRCSIIRKRIRECIARG